jgi:glycosyltransferase involved in cell wall biosynthesis
MRVAYVINSLEGGGAAAPIPSIAAVLAAHGCDLNVMALTSRDDRGLRAVQQAGLPVIIRQGGEVDHFAARRWLDEQVMRWQPNLIWTSLTRATLLGQIVGRAHGIDVVSWQHNAYLKPINRLLLKVAQHRSILWVADSNNVAQLTRDRLGVEPERIVTWPLFSADADAPQVSPWQRGQPFRIGSLGRLHPAKGYDILMEALALLRRGGFALPAPLQVEIAGDGRLHAKLLAQAKRAGLDSVRLVGFAEPRAFLASLNLYVQPSRREGLCIAAHEAMQAGLPVIASAVGELPYSLVDGVTGRLVPPEDPYALAEALASVLVDPARLAVMGQSSRSRVLHRFGGRAFALAGGQVMERLAQIRAQRQAPPL